MCRSMVDIQSPTAEIRRGKKEEEEEEERNYRIKILWSALLHRATINSTKIMRYGDNVVCSQVLSHRYKTLQTVRSAE